MKVYEAASITVAGKNIIVVRVPDLVLCDSGQMGTVIARAEKGLSSRVVLLGLQSGQIVGNPADKNLLLEGGFDPEKARWEQWNMAEED